jgi:hypothetical protein
MPRKLPTAAQLAVMKAQAAAARKGSGTKPGRSSWPHSWLNRAHPTRRRCWPRTKSLSGS